MKAKGRILMAACAAVLAASCTAGPGSGTSVWNEISRAPASWSMVGAADFAGTGMDTPRIAVDSAGTPWAAIRNWSYGGDISVHRFDGSQWILVGTGGLTGGNSSFPCLVFGPDGLPIVACIDSASTAQVYRFDGTSWSNLGASPISAGVVSDISLGIAGSRLFCSYADNTQGDRLVVQAFDPGTGTWYEFGGSPATPASVWYTHTAVDAFGNPWVSFNDTTAGNDTSVVHWDGGSWSFAGAHGLFGSSSQTMSLAFDPAGVPWLAGNVDGVPGARALKWAKGTWNTAGPSILSAGGIRDATVDFTPGGVPFLAYQDQANGNRATLKSWSGTTWLTTGTEGFTAGTVSEMDMTLDAEGRVYIIYQDQATNGADVEVYQ
jgi:hypothetical protein